MPEVTIYTKPGCPYCFAAREDLKSRGIRFHEIDIVSHPEGRAEVDRLTHGEGIVPVIVEGGKVQVGFGGGG